MITRGDVRVLDVDRDVVLAALGDHFVQGRLTLDELEERLEVALTATTPRHLRAVVADLPGAVAALDERRPPPSAPLVARCVALLVVAALVAAWLLTTVWLARHGGGPGPGPFGHHFPPGPGGYRPNGYLGFP